MATATTGRKRKAQPLSPSEGPPTEKSKPRKKCERRGCEQFSPYPFCFVRATDKCAGDGHTARWYHLSAGQHFCNECFDYFYRSNKPGNLVYNSWCTLWERESGERVTPGAKMFLVDQYLPVWVRCTLPECRKWRKLPPAIELHHVKQDIVKCSDCSRPEDEVVAMVKKEEWINSVSYTPMLRFSSLAPLLSEYFPDGVGISPATIRHSGTTRKRVGKLVKKDSTPPGDNRESAIADGRGKEGVGEGGGEKQEGEEGEEKRKEVETMLGKVAEGVRGGEGGGREGREGGEEGVRGGEGGGREGREGGEEGVRGGEEGGSEEREGGEEEKERQMVKVEGEGVAVEPKKIEVAGKTLVDKNGHHVPTTLLHPLHPFHHPHEGPRAQAFTPDVMEPMEIRAFPQFYRVYETQGKWHCPRLEIYCLMRNIILGLWFQNCKSYLTEKRCVEALSLRGLLRIWSSLHISSVLHFLTLHGFVNHGFLDDIPRPLPFPQSDRKIRVLIIGAGTAGIAAANHLRNYGHSVRILEAQGELGGRVRDDFSLGPCVGMGAMFITGICNNPFTLLAEQLGIPLRVVDEDRCDLVTEGQGKVGGEADLKVEKYFNRTLDLLADWRIGQNWDVPLQTKLEELHTTVLSLEQVSRPYTPEEKSLLDFHYSNLEFACGAQLSQISSLNWDHNDTFSQFSGPHAILPTGYHAILTGMARGIDIAYHTTVETVEVVGEGVRVGDQNGQFWEADKVVVTVPLSVLRAEKIKFSPSLGDKKSGAIGRLGAGLVEKVAIRFSEPFWRQSLGNCDFFGRVASNTDSRGMFGMFYDMSSVWSRSNSYSVGTNSETKTEGPTPETRGPSENSPTEGSFILLTTISGKALLWYHAASDSEIVDSCLKTLRLMFGTSAVMEVQGYLVSRWGSEPHVGMSYSYVAVGSTGEDYDVIAETAHGHIHFAGEATNRQHPQTVTGAYLSGLREACKIMADLK